MYIQARIQGGHLGYVPPGPLEPNAQRINLWRLNDLLDNTNELIRETLSQSLHD